MKLGICLPHYGLAMEPGRMREFAERVESLGFDSLWVTDHIIVPTGMAIVYKERMLEPLATLAYLAGVTRRVALGTSVIILPYRNPVIVAKAIASADALSGGRVIFGAASGWMEAEFRALNAEYERRGEVSDEYLRLIRELWTNPQPAFTGQRFTISEMAASPQPVQKPHPPIWIGGRSRRAMRRAVELGDGWHPTLLDHSQLRESIQYLEELSQRQGRPSRPEVSMRASVVLTDRDGADQRTLRGSAQQIADAFKRYEELGVTHMAVSLPDAPMDQALADMERFAAEVVPQLRTA